MNSPDPWRVMQSSPPAQTMVVPAGNWRHPFFGYGYPQGWAGGTSHAWEQGRERGEHVFVGTVAPAQRGDLTALIAPAVAPATGGFSARVELDAEQRLHAEICVDGKTYQTSIDLAPAIAAVMARIAREHAALHAALPTQISGDLAIGAVDQAVGAAADALVGSLLDRHVTVACGGFLDDIGNALKGAGGAVLHGVQGTLSSLKGPILAAATTAATAAATGIGGPMAGAAAAKLVGPLITSVTTGKTHPAVEAAEQLAKDNPQAAAALAAAKQAAAHTIAAFHVAETAKKAAAGHPIAQQQIAQVVTDAESGDPAAHAVAPLVAHGFATAAETRRQVAPSYRSSAIHAVTRALQRDQQQGKPPVPAIGYVRYAGKGKHHHKAITFQTPNAAHNWYASLAPGQYVYAAIFDANNLGAPLAETFGTSTV